jgi:hypothetical protein
MYNSAQRTLQELDPNNPQLRSFNTPGWIPSARDVRGLNNEIARIRSERRLDLEGHHNLPREFEDEFNACRLDPDDFVTYLSKPDHRLKPDGLHTGPNHWNGQWNRFFDENPDPKPKEVFQHLRDMLRNIGR